MQKDLPIIVGEPVPILYVRMEGTGVPVVTRLEPRLRETRRLPSFDSNSGCRVEQEDPQQADYFATNAARMRYPQSRKQHLFVGSGVIAAGCKKTAIGHLLKQSGRFSRRLISTSMSHTRPYREHLDAIGIELAVRYPAW